MLHCELVSKSEVYFILSKYCKFRRHIKIDIQIFLEVFANGNNANHRRTKYPLPIILTRAKIAPK